MTVYHYRNSLGTPMVKIVADAGYTLTKDDHNYKEIVRVPESQLSEWKEIKKVKNN